MAVYGCLDRHGCLSGTRVEKLRLLELLKINFIMPEDIAITSSKSDVDSCSHGRETDRQKSVDGQTDFQLYIVDRYIYIYIC